MSSEQKGTIFIGSLIVLAGFVLVIQATIGWYDDKPISQSFTITQWATAKLTAFTDNLVEEQAERIDSKRKEIAKKRLANKQLINPIYVLTEKGAKMEIASQLADKMGFTEQVAEETEQLYTEEP